MRLDTSVVGPNDLRGSRSGRVGRNHWWYDGRNDDRRNWREWFADKSYRHHGYHDQAIGCCRDSSKRHNHGNASLSLGAGPAWRASAGGSIWLWKSFGARWRSNFPNDSLWSGSRTGREHHFRTGASQRCSGTHY